MLTPCQVPSASFMANGGVSLVPTTSSRSDVSRPASGAAWSASARQPPAAASRPSTLASAPAASRARAAIARLGTLRVAVLAQAERERDQQNAFGDRVGADHEEQRQRAGAGPEQQNQAEHDREQSSGGEQPLVVDLAAQPDRADDLHHAGRDCPAGDEEQQYQRGKARPHEGEDAGGDAGEPNHGKPPARRG